MSESSARPDQPLVEPLTDRELEILSLIAQRRTNPEIADTLILSLNTVNQGFTLEDYTADDWYAGALATADFDGDGFDELAVGIPGEDLHSWFNIGAAEILYGGSGGLHRRSGRDDFWTQNDAGMEDGPEMGDQLLWLCPGGHPIAPAIDTTTTATTVEKDLSAADREQRLAMEESIEVPA